MVKFPIFMGIPNTNKIMEELETNVKDTGMDIFAVVHVKNAGNGTTFPQEINNYLSQGYHVHSVNIPAQATGSNAIAFVTLRKNAY